MKGDSDGSKYFVSGANAENTVIAPYATLLAAQFKPREAVANLAEIEAIGGRGRYGYYDAIDFTPSRVPTGANHAVVRNYMAHHTGMSIVAVANVVFEGRMRDRFHSDAVIEAADHAARRGHARHGAVAAARDRGEGGHRFGARRRALGIEVTGVGARGEGTEGDEGEHRRGDEIRVLHGKTPR